MSFYDPCLGTYNAFRGDEVLQHEAPTLYHSSSHGCIAASIAVRELGKPWRSRCIDFYAASLTSEKVRACLACAPNRMSPTAHSMPCLADAALVPLPLRRTAARGSAHKKRR